MKRQRPQELPEGNCEWPLVTGSNGQTGYMCMCTRVCMCVLVCVCADVSTSTSGIYLFTICLRKAAASHENLHLH